MRKGELDERGMSKFADTYGKFMAVRVAPVTKNDERVVVLGLDRNETKKGTFKQAVLRKEDGAWRIFQLR